MTTETHRKLGAAAKVKKSADGSMRFICSTNRVDRSGEIVEQNWDLEAFKVHGPGLYNHDHDGLPVCKWIDTEMNAEGQLESTPVWVPEDIYPFAGTVKALAELDFIKCVSVGFRPIEMDGPVIKRSELLEISFVNIPCNADALRLGAKNMLPVVRGDIPADIRTRGMDEIKVKAWLSAEPVKDDMTKTNTAGDDATHAESAVEAKLADASDVATKDAGELADVLSTALEACKGNDAATCQAALETAIAMVAAMDAPEDEAPEADAPPAGMPVENATPEPNKSAAEIVALTKRVDELTERVTALDLKTKALDETDFASSEDVMAFVNKTLGV